MYFSVNGYSGPTPRCLMRPTGCSTES